MAVGSGAVLGFDSLLGVAEETAFGTFVTASTWVEFDSESIVKTVDFQNQNSLVGRRGFHRRVEGQHAVAGDITYNLNAVNGLMFIKNVMGGSVTSLHSASSITTGTNQSHTIELGDWSTQTAPAALSIQKRVGATQMFEVSGARVNQMVISGSINNPVKATVNIVAQDMSLSAASNATLDFSTVRPFLFFDGTYTSDATTTSLGTTVEDIMSFELTINNNIITDDGARRLGSKTIQNLTPGQREVNLSISQRFDSTAAYDRWLVSSFQAIRIHLDTGDTIGSVSGATTYSMIIDVRHAFLQDGAVPVVSDAGIVTLDMTWNGLTLDTANTAGAGEVQIKVWTSLSAL